MNDYSNFDSEVFSCVYEDETAVIFFKSESFLMAMNASKMHELLDCLNTIEVDPQIKGLLTLHAADFNRIEVTKNFMKDIQAESGYVQKEMGVTRYGNAVKRLTLAINEFSKPSVVGIEGAVSIDSFGYFLACDYRIAAEDVQVEFTGLKMGIVPVGAVSLFMSRQMGATKALEVLMCGKTLTAQDAKNISIISEISPLNDLKASCLRRLKEFYSVTGASTLNLTKQLVRPKTHELEEHFESSSRLLWQSIIDQ